MGTDTHPPDMIANMQVGLLSARIVEGNSQAVSASDMVMPPFLISSYEISLSH